MNKLKELNTEEMSFKTLLLNYRVMNRLTQQELADKLGVHRITLLEWEKGFTPRRVNEMRARMIMES